MPSAWSRLAIVRASSSMARPNWLKPAVEDLKAYYQEAMTAQPGEYDAETVKSQFWRDTVLGAAILELYHYYQQAEDNRLKLIARMLAPREAVGRKTGPRRNDNG